MRWCWPRVLVRGSPSRSWRGCGASGPSFAPNANRVPVSTEAGLAIDHQQLASEVAYELTQKNPGDTRHNVGGLTCGDRFAHPVEVQRSYDLVSSTLTQHAAVIVSALGDGSWTSEPTAALPGGVPPGSSRVPAESGREAGAPTGSHGLGGVAGAITSTKLVGHAGRPRLVSCPIIGLLSRPGVTAGDGEWLNRACLASVDPSRGVS